MSMMDAARAGQSRIMAEPPGPGQQSSPGQGKVPMSDVRYRPADNPAQSCGRCTYFDGMSGCQLVAGVIRPEDTCDLFQPDIGPEGPPVGAPPGAPPAPGGAPPAGLGLPLR